ncbi:hypothetical protein HDU67_004483 [Dinochytrium kinnereticum]|nr:hypothetical protein HDU67_004483 [Dinochytrium kinnereticum]
MLRRTLLAVAISALWSCVSVFGQASSNLTPITIEQRVLILTTGDGLEESPIYSLRGYSIPYTVLTVTAAGFNGPLPLEAVTGNGALYSMIVLSNGGMAADFGGGVFRSVLTTEQWTQIYAYQSKYNVRLIALNDIPGNAGSNGVTARALDTWGTNDPNVISITSTELAARAGLKTGFTLSTVGLFHIPGTIVNSTVATPFLSFSPSAGFPSETVGGAIYNFTDGLYPREQMSFFLPFGSWSPTCLILSHLWVQWGTRGTYNGFRRVLATMTIDDFFLFTASNDENGKAVRFRTSIPDMEQTINWQNDLNRRLPAGSIMKLELAFNGNGILSVVDSIKKTSYALPFDPDLTDAPLDWKKPLGTGMSLWPNPPPPKNYVNDLVADTLFAYFKNNATARNSFFWNSHTFTHEILNNNSYSDTFNEVSFNYHMAQQLGLPGTPVWSNFSMVTTGISGLFNGDALQALMEFGITAAVGDSSRPKTLNSSNPDFWPMITTTETNGYPGFTVVPRSATNIYFNTTNPVINALIYNEIYSPGNPGQFSFDFLMQSDVDRVTRMLVGLSWVPYMFHQANLRTADAVEMVNPGTGRKERISLTAYWVEAVLASFYRYTNWPIISLKSDDFTIKFQQRAIYENCGVKTFFSGFRDSVTGQVYVTSLNAISTSTCTAPFTVPAKLENVAVTGSTYSFEQIGQDPLTVWVDMKPGVNIVIQIKDSVNLS